MSLPELQSNVAFVVYLPNRLEVMYLSTQVPFAFQSQTKLKLFYRSAEMGVYTDPAGRPRLPVRPWVITDSTRT